MTDHHHQPTYTDWELIYTCKMIQPGFFAGSVNLYIVHYQKTSNIISKSNDHFSENFFEVYNISVGQKNRVNPQKIVTIVMLSTNSTDDPGRKPPVYD